MEKTIRHKAGMLLFVLFLVVSLVACASQAAQTRNIAGLDVNLQERPMQGMKQELLITLVDKENKPVDGATVDIEGNMNHAGMTPVFVKGEAKGNGQYMASIEYTMTGQWSLTVKARTPDGDSIQKIFPKNVHSTAK